MHDRRRPILDIVIGLAALAQAVVIALGFAPSTEVVRAVIVRLPDSDSSGGDSSTGTPDAALQIASIDVAAASVVLLVFVALVRLVSAVPAVTRFRAGAAERGTHGYRWTEAAFVWPIIVFLIAQLNGITDIGALVAVYALASAVALFAFLQDRAVGGSLAAFSFGTMVGIVPWGIIAFHQIGAGLGGVEPSLGLRIITLAMLGAVLLAWALQWREARRASVGDRGGRDGRFALTSFAAVSVFAWVTVLAPL